jgi:hypothetical protein
MVTNSTIPSNPTQNEDDNQDASGYEKCEQDIQALQQWATQAGQKIGVPFSGSQSDEPDALSTSLADTKPFGAGAGISNS